MPRCISRLYDSRFDDFGTPATTTPGEVRFEMAPPNDAAILVPVKINGHGPYAFILDTGATLTCIVQKLVDQLIFPRKASVRRNLKKYLDMDGGKYYVHSRQG